VGLPIVLLARLVMELASRLQRLRRGAGPPVLPMCAEIRAVDRRGGGGGARVPRARWYKRTSSGGCVGHQALVSGPSCRMTATSDSCTVKVPLYSTNPSLRNLFMKKFTRDRVVPIIWARAVWEMGGSTRSGPFGLP